MSTLQERLRAAGNDYTIEWGSGALYDEAAACLDELEREVEALRADAERYRWLRLPTSNVPISHEAAKDAEVYDAAIDAARSKT